jgi:hypothetical protein
MKKLRKEMGLPYDIIVSKAVSKIWRHTIKAIA